MRPRRQRRSTNAGTGNNATVTINTLTDNAIVHAACVSDDTSITAGSTSRNNVSGTSGSCANEDTDTPISPIGAAAMAYSGLSTTASWAMTGYAVRPDTAGALFKGRAYYETPVISL